MPRLTDEIVVAAEVLARDPRTQNVAGWLAAGCPGSIFAHLGLRGDLAADTYRRDRRRDWLLKIAPPGRGAAPRLARWLAEYKRRYWDGEAGTRNCSLCPHPPGSREEALWSVLKFRDRALTERQVRNIIQK